MTLDETQKKAAEKRIEDIKAVYKELLSRDADESGLMNYFKSNLSIEEVREAIAGSFEYLEKQRVKNFDKTVSEIGSEELMLLGSAPKTEQNIDLLKKRGVKAILSLDAKASDAYDHDWVEKFLCVDFEKNKYFSIDRVELALKFLYEQIVVNKFPTYIHSSNGFDRAPLLGALFLVASKGMTYSKSLDFIMNKSKAINPNKFYITSAVLNHTYSLRGALSGYVDIEEASLANTLEITENIHFSTLLEDAALAKLKKSGFNAILDLNTEKTKFISEHYGWFNHIHLPVFSDKIEAITPVILKNINRLSNNGKVVVLSSERGVLFALFGEMISGKGGAYIIEDTSSIVKNIFNL